jgi:hypothetical protein
MINIQKCQSLQNTLTYLSRLTIVLLHWRQISSMTLLVTYVSNDCLSSNDTL